MAKCIKGRIEREKMTLGRCVVICPRGWIGCKGVLGMTAELSVVQHAKLELK